MRILAVLTAVLLPLFGAAQFSRLLVEEVPNKGVVPGKTYRIYAVMEREGDVIDAVYGEKNAPLRITSTAPFYQHPKGNALSADIQRYDLQNDNKLKYDSWFTIGSEDNYMNRLTGFLVDFAAFESGQTFETNNGAWFVTPDQPQGRAPKDKRILLMQLTSVGTITGVINLHGRTFVELDASGNPVSAPKEIKAEGLTFTCGK
jgi:hypothetical protein